MREKQCFVFKSRYSLYIKLIRSQAVVVFCESEDEASKCLSWLKEWGIDIAIAGGRHIFHAASFTDRLVIGKEHVTVNRVYGLRLSQPSIYAR